jgi:hypothetical protein
MISKLKLDSNNYVIQNKGKTGPKNGEFKCNDQFQHSCHENCEDKNSWNLSKRLAGMVVGAADGIKSGLIGDLACAGIPIVMGFFCGGLIGAAIGGAILPAFFGTIEGLDGFVHPEKHVN